jgi:hypothetical protein
MEIDDIWMEFLSKKNNTEQDDISVSSDSSNLSSSENPKELTEPFERNEKKNIINNLINSTLENTISNGEEIHNQSSNLYISTKSKLAYLSENLDLKKIFWNIQITPYSSPINGVIKKQIKYSCNNEEELNHLQSELKKNNYYEEKILKNIKTPTGRVKFKDIRKVSIGISTKDILSFRSKEKGAFYNCLVLIIRYKVNDIYREFHAKFFNTGKVEIPGIQNDDLYNEILDFILVLLKPLLTDDLHYIKTNEIVLINSDFNCGFYINQEVLYNILKYKYNIQCIYDPCSYPGLQCKFYYNYILEDMSGHQTNNMTIKENKKSENDVIISFMIFRTGSVLISGKCNEIVINKVYNFIKNMLLQEHSKIFIKNNKNIKNKIKNKKLRKRTIYVKK